MSETQSPQTEQEKVGIGAYIYLIFACIFFSGVLAGSNWWSVFDFTTLNGSLGKVVTAVSQTADGVTTALGNFRGKGGSGAMDGFVFARPPARCSPRCFVPSWAFPAPAVWHSLRPCNPRTAALRLPVS